jgi:uncharacterized protein (TIGR03067 family)
MRTLTTVSLVVGVCLAGASRAAEKEKKKDDADKMQGTWQAVKVVIRGVELQEEIVKNLKYDIKGNKITTLGVPDIIAQYGESTFKLDSSTKPKSLDLKITLGERKGDELEGIYEFTGDDDLKLCVNLMDKGKERPDAFATKEGDNRGLVVLKREKK